MKVLRHVDRYAHNHGEMFLFFMFCFYCGHINNNLCNIDASPALTGLAVPLVGVNAFATAAPLIDKMVVVRLVKVLLLIGDILDHIVPFG